MQAKVSIWHLQENPELSRSGRGPRRGWLVIDSEESCIYTDAMAKIFDVLKMKQMQKKY